MFVRFKYLVLFMATLMPMAFFTVKMHAMDGGLSVVKGQCPNRNCDSCVVVAVVDAMRHDEIKCLSKIKKAISRFEIPSSLGKKEASILLKEKLGSAAISLINTDGSRTRATTLCAAVIFAKPAVVRFLCKEYGLDVNKTNIETFKTPLQALVCAQYDSEKDFKATAHALLDYGADVSLRIYEGATIFERAQRHFSDTAGRWLSEVIAEREGASSSKKKKKKKKSKAEKKLILDRVLVDLANTIGEDDLKKAQEIIEQRLVSGLQAEQIKKVVGEKLNSFIGVVDEYDDSDDILVLHVAAARRNAQAIRLLHGYGADITLKDKEGVTVLMALAFSNCGSDESFEETMRVLLEFGVDPNARDIDGITAQDIANESGRGELFSRILAEFNGLPAEEEEQIYVYYSSVPEHMKELGVSQDLWDTLNTLD